MGVLVLSEADVRRLLPMEDCIEVMADALAALERGDMSMPLRSVFRPPDAGSLMGLMPAHRVDAAYGLKAICVFPGNPARSLDAHQGAVLLFDGETGELRAAMNASAITEIRTAAVSAVATRLLARDDARTLAILGAGVQARAHVAAMRAVREFERVRVWSRTPEHARALAGDAGCEAVVSAEEALAGADVVCTTTSASEPLPART
jgi:ornithine cyclodeaminase/alanine dehydrogenase-like protein (mu-crystallin family)